MRGKPSFSGALVVEEEERLILDDRATHGTTEVVFFQRRNWFSMFVGEPFVRVRNGIAQKLIEGTVKFVGSGARDDVDDGPTCKPEFCGEVALLNLEFLDRIHGRRVRFKRLSAILLKICCAGAVEKYVRSSIPTAVRVEVNGIRVVLLHVRLHDSRCEAREGEKITVQQG